MMQIMRGVEKGSEKSLAMVNEVLIYKSPRGSAPIRAGSRCRFMRHLAMCDIKMRWRGHFRGKYYVSMQWRSKGADICLYTYVLDSYGNRGGTHCTRSIFAKAGRRALLHYGTAGLIGDGSRSIKPYEGAAEETRARGKAKEMVSRKRGAGNG